MAREPSLTGESQASKRPPLNKTKGTTPEPLYSLTLVVLTLKAYGKILSFVVRKSDSKEG